MRGLHRILVGQGWVSPVEFWALPPVQAWWIVADRMPAQTLQAREDRDEMLRMLRKAKADEAA